MSDKISNEEIDKIFIKNYLNPSKNITENMTNEEVFALIQAGPKKMSDEEKEIFDREQRAEVAANIKAYPPTDYRVNIKSITKSSSGKNQGKGSE